MRDSMLSAMTDRHVTPVVLLVKNVCEAMLVMIVGRAVCTAQGELDFKKCVKTVMS